MESDDRFCGDCGAPVPGGDGASDDASGDPDQPGLFDQPVRTMTSETVRVDLDDEPTTTGRDAPTEVIAVTGGVDLAVCPSCEAVNAVERLRCARCGAALHDDVEETDTDGWELREPSSVESPAEPAAVPAPPAGRARWLGVLVVVVGALLGVVLAAWLFGVGPFERATGVGIEFDGDEYPGTAEPVSAQRARTSEVLPDEGGRTFGAPSVVDGDLETAWVAVDPDEARLEFAFDRPVWISQLEFANGDQFDDGTFESAARVRTLDLDFGFNTLVRATLLSATGRQVVRLPEPILADRVTMDVMDVTPGEGVGLSEIRFIGYVAHDQDVQAWDEAT